MMNKIFVGITLGTLVGVTICLYVTFMVAYFHPTKSVTIYIDKFGEANIEFIMLNILVPISLVYSIIMAKRVGELG